jgi:MFS family permease
LVSPIKTVLGNARGPLSSRDYRLYLTAQVGSYAGTSISTIALAFAALRLGGADALSVVLACAAIPEVLFLLVGGALADRYNRRTMIVAANLVSGAAQLSAAVLLLSGQAAAWHLAVLAAVGGTATAWVQPASRSILRNVVSPDDRPAAVALQRLLQNAFRIGGPAIGGLLVALFDPGWALLVDAVSFLFAAALQACLRPQVSANASASAGVVADLRVGWLDFWSRRWLVLLVAQGSLCLLFWLVGIQLLGPSYAAAELGGADVWGVVLACFAVGLVGGSLVATSVRPRRVGIMSSLGVAGLGLPLFAMAAGWPVFVLCVLAVAAGVTMDISVVTQSALMQRAIPEEIFGRVIAFTMVGELGLIPLGYLLFGPVAVHLGLHPALWTCAVGVVVCAGVPLLTRAVRDLGENGPEERLESVLAAGAS